jgi:hypothetical protein
LVGVTLSSKQLRPRKRSPWLAVSGPAVIRKLLEFDRHHFTPAEAVSGRWVLGSHYPSAWPRQGAQWWAVQILGGDDHAGVVPDLPGDGHGQADEVGHLDTPCGYLWLLHMASPVQNLVCRWRTPDPGGPFGAAREAVNGRQVSESWVVVDIVAGCST